MNRIVQRYYISQYEMCFEIWHNTDPEGDIVVSHKEVFHYYPDYDGKFNYADFDSYKVKRSSVPAAILAEFSLWAEDRWYEYVEALEGH